MIFEGWRRRDVAQRGTTWDSYARLNAVTTGGDEHSRWCACPAVGNPSGRPWGVVVVLNGSSHHYGLRMFSQLPADLEHRPVERLARLP